MEFMESICDTPFWDLDLSWNTDKPYLTPCFESTVLIWVPCAFLWIFTPMDVYYAIRSKLRNVPWSALNICQMFLSILLILFHLILFLPVVLPSDESKNARFLVQIITPLILIATYIMTIALQIFTKRKGVRSSGVQFIFWFLLLCAETVILRSLIDPSYMASVPTPMEYAVKIIIYASTAAQFFLHCWSDVAPIHSHDGSLNTNGIKKTCPEEKSSYLSRLTFHWYNGLALKAYRKPLEMDDLWELNDEDKSEALVPAYRKYYEEQQSHGSPIKRAGKKERKGAEKGRSASYSKLSGIEITDETSWGKPKKQISIIPILFKTLGGTFVFGALLKIIPDLLLFVSPQILNLLIAFVKDKPPEEAENDYLWKGYLFALLLFGSAILQTLFTLQYSHRMYMTALRVRTVLVSAIYRKALVVSNAAKRTSTLGEVVNLMSVDVQRVMDNIPFVNMLWSAPFQIILAMYFLFGILGYSVLAGLTVIILLVPANAILAQKARKLQVTQMKYKDERIKLISEILSGVKVLKLYAWETSFQEQILSIRMKEIKVLRDQAYLNAGTNFLWTCAPFLIALSTFGTYVLIDETNILDAQKVFVSMSLLNVISLGVAFLPMIIMFVVQAAVSTKRINNFLNSEEIKPNTVTHDESEPDPIVIENGTFAWDDTPTLRNINLAVKEGSLIAIVGTVGAGKSSLISAMLGELEKISGRVNTKGIIGYVAQQAWIQNVSLRNNIVFGNKFDRTKYDKVIEACALLPDLEILPAGDQTEIGEKGINLSGGQKQRVALARAVYNNADSYLFDDPLSAVDSHVGKHIFDKVIGPKGYLKKKTRVLVTHGIAFLPQVDQIVVMKDGKISEVGTYQELLDRKGAFAEFLTQHITPEDLNEIEDSSVIEGLTQVVPLERILSMKRKSSKSEHESDFEANATDVGPRLRRQRTLSDASGTSGNSLSRKESVAVKNVLIEAEKSETESVKFTVYVDYFRAAGLGLTFGMVSLYVIYQVFAIAANLWLSKWTEEPVVNGTQDASARDMYLGVYGGLGIMQSISIMGATIMMAIGTLKSAAVLHQRMLARILKAPMSFFDTTPVGRIVNRFAKDIDVLDNTIPFMVRLWLNSFLQVASTIIIISYTTPIFVAVIIPIGIVYYFVQRMYVSSSRQLKRIESTSRSPIYSHFGETVSGSATIRAYRQQERFIQESEAKVDRNQTCYFPAVVANRWLQLRLETLGNVVILFAAIFAVLAREDLEPGLVGLSISYALQITMALNMLVRWTSDLETNIVSVERVKEYTEFVPSEAAWVSDTEPKPPKDWPENGVVEFNNYQTRYRDGLDLVLRNVTCKINGGEKIGIVGRTGAGKSSMTLALFRIVEAAGGSITIDGKNISKMGLHDVRGRITIIPQDPVLFSGTLRNNLDPFERETDNKIWKALELAHLKSFASSLPAGLSHEITEGGENLSVGQRQLVCLARALLRKSKILVLDEATAAVDLETDDLIQQTIRKEFSDCTVITIAHRLNTIMDSTRVIVLDKGEIREFDTPANLMKDKNTIFYGMAKDAGISSI